MRLKECVEQAFGEDGHSRVMQFLLDRELADCQDDGERWRSLFEKSDRWKRSFFLWSEDTYIDGITGWHLDICVGRFRLPPEPADWLAYLYRMSLLLILRDDHYATAEGRRRVIEHASHSSQWKDDYSCGFDIEYFLESGYAELTRTEWLEELNGFWRTSWERWQKDGDQRTNNPEYAAAMKVNYPQFKTILERLEREAGACQVVRMNRHGGDETVWYFAKAEDSFFVIALSDAM